MAKLTLDIESNALSVFDKALESMSELSSGVSDFEKQGKKSFDNVTKEAEGLNNEIVKGAESTSDFVDETIKLSKSSNVIKDLKKQIKEYESQAFKAALAGDKALGEEFQRKAGAAKNQLSSFNTEVKALTGNFGQNLAKAASEATTVIATGFEGILSTQILLGDKSKEFEETLLKLQAINGIANVAREFAGISDKLTEIKLGFAPVTQLFTNGASSIVDSYSNVNESLKGFFSNFTGNAKAAITGAAGYLKDFGKQSVQVAKNLGTGFVSFFSNFGTNMKAFATSAKAGINTIGTAIRANPLGIILTIVGLIIGAMVLLRDKVKPIMVLFQFLGDIIGAIADHIESLLQAIGLTASESEKANQKIIDSHAEVREAIENRYDNEIKLLNAAGKETAEKEKEKLKAVRESIKQQLTAMEIKKARGEELSDEETEAYKKSMIEQKNILFDLAAIDLRVKKERADAAKAAAKEAEAAAKEAAQKQLQLQKDLQQGLADLAKRAQQAELEGLYGKERLDRQKEINDKDLQALRDLLQKKGELLNKNFKFSAEQEEQFAILKTRINEDYYDAILKLEVENSNKIAESRKKEIDSEVEFLELKAKLAEERIKGTTAPKGISKDAEVTFELLKQKQILEIRKQAAIDLLQIKQDAIDAETNKSTTALENELKLLEGRNDAISIARASAIEKEIEAIEKSAVVQKEILVAQTQSTVSEINKELDKIGENLKPKKIDLEKLLGGDASEISFALKAKVNIEVSQEDVQSAKDALSTLADSLKSIMNDYFEAAQAQLDQELEMNAQRIESHEEMISSLKDQLANEKELRDQGLANDVERIQAQIKEVEAARQRDLDNERRLKKEKLKLAKEQLVIDTITQASQMVLAIAQLYASLSSFTIGPIPVGVIIATATSAAMVGAFIAGKKKAFEAVNSGNQGLRKGGYTGDGNWDEPSGHFTHKGEFVNTAEDTLKYKPLFEGIHKKDKSLMEIGLRDLLKDTGVVLDSEIPKGLSDKKESTRAAEIKMQFANDNSGVESRIDNVESHIKKLVKQGEFSTTVKPDGTVIEKRGSITRVIKPRK
jgi:DNA repair exonuclease SbcCD ATPase subunit